MKALRDNVIVSKIKEETKSESGLILTGTEAESLFQKGVVMSVGKDVELISVADTVVFIKNQGADITDDGEKFTIVGNKHVVAKV